MDEVQVGLLGGRSRLANHESAYSERPGAVGVRPMAAESLVDPIAMLVNTLLSGYYKQRYEQVSTISAMLLPQK